MARFFMYTVMEFVFCVPNWNTQRASMLLKKPNVEMTEYITGRVPARKPSWISQVDPLESFLGRWSLGERKFIVLQKKRGVGPRCR